MGSIEYSAGVGAGRTLAEAGVTNALCLNVESGNDAMVQRCEGMAYGLGSTLGVTTVLGTPIHKHLSVTSRWLIVLLFSYTQVSCVCHLLFPTQ